MENVAECTSKTPRPSPSSLSTLKHSQYIFLLNHFQKSHLHLSLPVSKWGSGGGEVSSECQQPPGAPSNGKNQALQWPLHGTPAIWHSPVMDFACAPASLIYLKHMLKQHAPLSGGKAKNCSDWMFQFLKPKTLDLFPVTSVPQATFLPLPPKSRGTFPSLFHVDVSTGTFTCQNYKQCVFLGENIPVLSESIPRTLIVSIQIVLFFIARPETNHSLQWLSPFFLQASKLT